MVERFVNASGKTLDYIVRQQYAGILNDNLTGIYLHGSLAMGCFTGKSDIDLLVLVNSPLADRTKRALVDRLLNLRDLPDKGIEISVVLGKYAREFQYPTPFEVHYSESFKEAYRKDPDFICGNGVDKDLAAHMTMVYHRGICLYGKEIREAFGEIPRKYYIDSLLHDLEEVRTGIVNDPVYYSLNLCRILYYLKDNFIASKKEGGDWGLKNLPEKYKGIIKNAVGVYTNQLKTVPWEQEALLDFAEYMLREIFIALPPGEDPGIPLE